MKLETPSTTIFKSNKEAYNYLIDLKNFKQLLPENTEKFEANSDSFLFALSGMPEIKLVLKEQIPYSKIILKSASGKLDFSLTLSLSEISENSTATQLFFNGDFNPMMAMMVKKPLTNLINHMGKQLQNI